MIIETDQPVSKDGTGPASIIPLALARLLNQRYGFSQYEAHQLIRKNAHLLARIMKEIAQ